MIPEKKTLMQTIKNRTEVLAAMSNGATLITPNNRLSNQLLNEFFKEGTTSIKDNPACLPYTTFLRNQYKAARHLYANQVHPILLTRIQQRYLWQEILTECSEGLLNEVTDAFLRCQHWQLDISHSAFGQTSQTQQFQAWCQLFQERLNALDALTEDQLAAHLLNYPELFKTTPTIWACFDDYTPQQRALQDAMREAGAPQYAYDLADKSTTTHLYPAKDCQDESLQMIQWLQGKLASGESRIAVVIPDLQSQSHTLQRLLQRHIAPNCFDISLGQPLISYPLVAHALCWLSMGRESLSHHQAHLLLNSPYIAGSQTEFLARSNALQQVKIRQNSIIPLPVLVESISKTAPLLAELLDTMPEYPNEAPISTWINHFKERLLHLGFPGDYPLISLAYQCFQRLMMLFDEFLQLALISPLMKKNQALNALHDLAASTIFQGKKNSTPIQILGLLEASGCTFDSVWVSGLTCQCLPKKTRLSAFIPIQLQRERLMPHALPERELQFAQQLLQRLDNGSRETVFSYPAFTGDIPNSPCPLIAHLPLLIPSTLPKQDVIHYLVRHDERYLIPLMPKEPVSGGTALLANQAKCPFRAFASHRLYAKPALTLYDGPDLRERGQIMHQIMDNLWRDLKSQQYLLSLTHDALQTKIKAAITTALQPFFTEQGLACPLLIQELEFSRLHQLVNASLAWEKKRPPFVVEGLEQAFTLPLAGINFRVRVDRLDSVSTDKKWVIDYKSTLPINKPWNEPRPEEPQLLLYALLNPSINALLFLQLKAGRVTCSGLSEIRMPIQGLTPLKKGESWSLQQQTWRQQLTQLATEFREGLCSPTPYRISTCQRCDFQNLCRIELS